MYFIFTILLKKNTEFIKCSNVLPTHFLVEKKYALQFLFFCSVLLKNANKKPKYLNGGVPKKKKYY